MILNSEDTFNIQWKNYALTYSKVHLYGTFQTRISQCDTCDVCCMTNDWTMHVTPVSVTTLTFLSASYEVHVLTLLVLFNKTLNLRYNLMVCRQS